MATFTVSVTASKIAVQGGTGNVAQLYADAIAESAGCMTNPSANVYQVEGNRELEVQSAADVTHEAGVTLQWNLTANRSTSAPNLDVRYGGTWRGEAGAVLIGDTNETHRAYFLFYGNSYIAGEDGNPYHFNKYYRTILYAAMSGSTKNATQDTVWSWVKMSEVTTGGYAILLFSGTTFGADVRGTRSLTDIEIDDCPQGTGPPSTTGLHWQKATLERWTFTNCPYPMNGTPLPVAVYKDFAISDFTSYSYAYGAAAGSQRMNAHYSSYRGEPMLMSRAEQQAVATFDGLNVTGAPNTYAFLAYYGTSVYVKNSVFTDVGYPFYTSSYAGAVILWGLGNRFANATQPDGLYASVPQLNSNLHVRELDLTVQDSDGNAIANALVHIRQAQGREEWVFYTDANGQIVGNCGDPFFAFREAWSTGDTIGWSNSDTFDFEPLGTGYTLYDDGWLVHEQSTSTAERHADAAHTGTNGLKVTTPSADQEAYVVRGCWDYFDAGETKTLEFWYQCATEGAENTFSYRVLMKNEDGDSVVGWYEERNHASDGGHLVVYHDDDSYASPDYLPAAKPPTGDWVKVKIEITRATTDSAADGSGALYFDYNDGAGYVKVAEATDIDNYDLLDESNCHMRIGSVSNAVAGDVLYFDELDCGTNPGLKHKLTVAADGYGVQSQEVAFDTPQAITVTMEQYDGVCVAAHDRHHLHVLTGDRNDVAAATGDRYDLTVAAGDSGGLGVAVGDRPGLRVATSERRA